MGLWEKVKRGLEIVHLKTDANYKGDLSHMTNDELATANSSTRRAKAGARTGLLANTGISLGHPGFAPAALLSAGQTLTTRKDRNRVKQEVERRKASSPSARHYLEQRDRPGHDVLIGATLRATFLILGNGVVGIDHISGHDGAYTLFQHHHPGAAQVDKALHGFFGGIGDKAAQEIGSLTGLDIKPEMSWDQLQTVWQKSHHSLVAVGVQTLLDGGVAEATQLTQIPEYWVDSTVEEKGERREEGVVIKMNDHQMIMMY